MGRSWKLTLGSGYHREVPPDLQVPHRGVPPCLRALQGYNLLLVSRLSILPGESSGKVTVSESVWLGDDSGSSSGFTLLDTVGELVIQARDEEIFTLNASVFSDFANSIF